MASGMPVVGPAGSKESSRDYLLSQLGDRSKLGQSSDLFGYSHEPNDINRGGPMLKRKNAIEEGPATRKKVRKDNVAQLIARLDPKILTKIFYELIMRGQAPATVGNFREPWHFVEYRRSVINCSARAALLGVCKKWLDIIIADVNFWKHIHIDGNRIPSPPKCYKKGWSGYHFEQYEEPTPEEENDLEVVQIVGELPRSALSIQRSQNTPVELVLGDPTYDPEPRFCQYGRPLLPCPGLLELLHERMDKGMIGSLSITTTDIQFVKELLDPGLELDERGMGYEEIDWISDAEKIALACDGKVGDHFDLSTLPAKAEQVDEEEHARLRKKFRVWPKLDTLRINTRGRSWMSDAHRCVFTAERAPALRHLELELWVDHPIWLWALPYAQLTHLTLATETADTVLLGIVARCASLESLTITLRDWEGTWKKPQSRPTDQVVLTYLKKLSVQIEAYNCLNHRIGRDFLNFIDTPQLESLEVITRNVDRASCFIHLLKRSKCQIRELRLDFDSKDITDNTRPGLKSEPPMYYGEPDSDDESDSDANYSDTGDGNSNADPVTVLPSETDAKAPAPGSTESGTRLVSKLDSGQDTTSSTEPNQAERNADTVNPPPVREPIEKFNLRELIHLVSPTLKTLAIQSGPKDGSWLHELTAPLLEEVTFVCFGITKKDYPNHDKVLVCGPAHDLAIDLLFWTEAWMKDATAEEKRIRKVSLVEAPAHRVGTQTFYGMSEFDIQSPDLGVNLSVWWYKKKRRSERERRAWLKSQPPKDKPANLKREPRIIKAY
ncbi:hypothetical protein DFP72DRAFT_1045392 [Ephemerocybe angulata]|uniref:Uncharacterized protein n=1 Tax=Ephemerocybe angulata TaxID=980116 RepID=A0A8H6HYN5_9AGAR|nr:hypothetical protein DFP72DRAFT_1045392 [Tulosesus angulatus]